MTALLDLSDITLASKGLSTPISPQAGYAYLPLDGEPELGDEALLQAKIHPTRINNRYLADLSTDPLTPAHPKTRHHADLLWQKLKQFQQAAPGAEFVVLVPSSYQADRLQLLAGICQSLDMNISAFVNRAIAAGARLPGSSGAVHVDLQQHQTLLTFLDYAEGTVSETGTEKLSGLGLVRFQEHWLHLIRRRFISVDRFDPMHSGETEQQLFTQLWRQTSSKPVENLEFTVSHNEQTYAEKFSADELATPYQDLISEVHAKSEGRDLILDQAFTGIPGVSSSKSQICSSEELFQSASKIVSKLNISNERGIFINRAELTAAEATPDLGDQAANSDVVALLATHLVVGGFAYIAGSYDLKVVEGQHRLAKVDAGSPSHFSQLEGKVVLGDKADDLRVNGQLLAPGVNLYPNDRISFGDTADTAFAILLAETNSS